MRANATLCALLLLAAGGAARAGAPKWLRKAREAQVTVLAYGADGQMRETQGCLIGPDGEVATEYDALKGAVRAVVIDSRGQEREVTEIAGASAMYNAAKLRAPSAKGKDQPLRPAQEQPGDSAAVYILPSCKADKDALCAEAAVERTDTFRQKYRYYTLTQAAAERQVNCPVVNGKGEALGLLQPAAKGGGKSFVLDLAFLLDLRTSAVDAANADLRAIPMKKALPQGEEEALSYIFLAGKADTALYRRYVDDFVGKYPSNAGGHVMLAELEADQGRYDRAEQAYQSGLATDGVRRDELHYSKSRAIYGAAQAGKTPLPAGWDMEGALAQAAAAREANPLPLYSMQEAECMYALKRYGEAADKYLSLTSTNMRSAELFMYAAQCVQSDGRDSARALALMDSALNCYTKPYPTAAAGVILVRAGALAAAGRAREAVAGYNDYEHLAQGKLTAAFYYEREQLELKCRMYPAALNDIEMAVKLSGGDPALLAECAALNYRVGQVDDAIVYARRAMERDPKFPDPRRILGVCLSHKGDKAGARKALEEAVSLGDPMAGDILKRLE